MIVRIATNFETCAGPRSHHRPHIADQKFCPKSKKPKTHTTIALRVLTTTRLSTMLPVAIIGVLTIAAITCSQFAPHSSIGQHLGQNFDHPLSSDFVVFRRSLSVNLKCCVSVRPQDRVPSAGRVGQRVPNPVSAVATADTGFVQSRGEEFVSKGLVFLKFFSMKFSFTPHTVTIFP